MTPASPIGTLRHALLIKIISRLTPSRADIVSAIEMMADRLMEATHAQSISFYIVEGNQISSTRVCYAPSLWRHDAAEERRFRDVAAGLLSAKIPRGRGIVGQVVESGEPIFFRAAECPTGVAPLNTARGLDVHAMLTVPLKTTITLGAIEVVNKEVAGTIGEFSDADLQLLQEFAEYLSTLIHRMVDPKFQPNPHESAVFIARVAQVPLIETVEEVAADPELVASVGETVIRHEAVFPYKRVGPNSVAALMTNPLDYNRREKFTEVTELAIEEVSVVSQPVFDALLKHYFPRTGTVLNLDDINITAMAETINNAYDHRAPAEIRPADLEGEDSGPVIQLTNRLIEDAYVSRASDIHIEPTEKELMIRYRVDGVCQDKLHLPRQVASALVTRIKIMCNLDISESRLPQDGRIVFRRFSNKNINVDLRVAICPTQHGEKVVMRVLDKAKTALPLEALGFSPENFTRYRECIRQPYGMILHCGPTGSGKSMTLYSALGELNTRDLNIQTAEDPIEYTLPGLNQTQMNRQIGLTFARVLRSYLRMDPDIILVGEIRDQETAQIAIEAALTGHLLVSTLHTNDAASAVARLAEMRIEPFNISASLLCVCAQRLLRRVCTTCRVPYEPKGREEEILEKVGCNTPIFRANPKGCPNCGGTGYRGRVGVHELMINSEELTEGINKGYEAAELKRIAMRNGMKTLHYDTLLKVVAGVTTLEEAVGNVPPDLIVQSTTVPLARVA